MMKLYTMPGTCALAPNIVSLWAGVAIEVVALKYGDHKTPAYLAINPTGHVPALVIGDTPPLTEAAAIMLYLAELGGDRALSGYTAMHRARVIEALSYMTSEVHADFRGHFAADRLVTSPEAQSELRKTTYARLDAHFRRLNTQLKDGWYLPERSPADAYLYVLVRWIGQTPLDPEDYPNLQSFRRRMERDPDVQAALTRQGMPLPHPHS